MHACILGYGYFPAWDSSTVDIFLHIQSGLRNSLTFGMRSCGRWSETSNQPALRTNVPIQCACRAPRSACVCARVFAPLFGNEEGMHAYFVIWFHLAGWNSGMKEERHDCVLMIRCIQRQLMREKDGKAQHWVEQIQGIKACKLSNLL